MDSWLTDHVRKDPRPPAGSTARQEGPAAEILRRVSIESLTGAKPGQKIVCPFPDHTDGDASLHVYGGDKGFHCFGCGRGGTVIDFVMLRDRLDVSQVVTKLADTYGIPLAAPATVIEMPERTATASSNGRAEQPVMRTATSWAPVDLTDTLTGSVERPEATILKRLDGAGLFYKGRFNMLFGPSESGKTWVALAAEAQVLADGGRVVHIDLESEQAEYVLRMRLLGATDTQLAEQVAYIYPDEALGRVSYNVATDADRDLAGALDPLPDLIVIDAMGELFDLHSLNPLANEDAPKVTRFLRRLATRTGAAVVVVDHVPHSPREGGARAPIGAQAKRAAVTGAALSCKASAPLAPGKVGKLILRVNKDRAGAVRAACPGGAEPVAARVVFDAETSGGRILTSVEPPRGEGEASDALQARMEQVVQVLRDVGGEDGLSKRKVRDAVPGKATLTDDALERLQLEGRVQVRKGARGALVHVLVDPDRSQRGGADGPL